MNIKNEIKRITDRMLKLRPQAELSYRPYRKDSVSSYEGLFYLMNIKLKELYPDAKEGQVAYVKTILRSDLDYDITILVQGNTAVYFNGSKLFDYSDEPTEEARVLTHVNKGDNELVFLCRCDKNGFGVSFVPSVRHYPGMWAKDYLLNLRTVCPKPEFFGETGFAVSELYDCEDVEAPNYVYPKEQDNNNEIIFSKVFPNAPGGAGYAYTECLEATKLTIEAEAECDVFVNGKEASKTVTLNKGDKVLVKMLKADKWGFKYSFDGSIGIPFMTSNRTTGDKWLVIAGLEPGEQFTVRFDSPYYNIKRDMVFWKLENACDYIRPMIDSCFYAQWFYAVMVGHFGLKKAGEVIGEKQYTDYFLNSIGTMAKFYMYMQYEKNEFTRPSFMQRSITPINLDSIGTMGMNMCELYMMTGDNAALVSAMRLYDAMKTNIPTFEDGTFNRKVTMWADDTYMSCPFLNRFARITDNKEISDFAAKQLLGFKDYLYMPEKKLFSHIYFVEEGKANRIPWGRGNGWVFVTLSDALEIMPEDTNGRDELLKLFCDFAEGVKNVQGEDGRWHQVMDIPESYLETSCTAMFIIGLCKGVRNGWLDKSYIDVIEKAHNGIFKECIDSDGNIYGVCKGSSCSMEAKYYMELGVVDNDDHGTGIVLWALSEMEKLYESM